ncbi:MAG: hypothetical protein PHV34_21485 [Verrucomicrobiae bacterium]|nr:hypothetical protein [Verrucomicrobiae bacterium]
MEDIAQASQDHRLKPGGMNMDKQDGELKEILLILFNVWEFQCWQKNELKMDFFDRIDRIFWQRRASCRTLASA